MDIFIDNCTKVSVKYVQFQQNHDLRHQFGNVGMLEQKYEPYLLDDESFYKYLQNCKLISSKITKDIDESSPKNKAIDAIYEFAKRATTLELEDEITFFICLDLFMSHLTPEIKEKCLPIYSQYYESLTSYDKTEIINALRVASGQSNSSLDSNH